jgi:plasmid replication initiation protein
MQRKMINGLIYIAQKNPESEIFETNAEYLKKICGFNLESNSYMQEQLKKIKEISFEFNYLEKDKTIIWSVYDLLSEITFEFGSGKIKFAFPPTLKKNILNPVMYAPLNIILIAGLKCSYAIVLYEFLRDYLTAPSVPIMTIEDFRNILGISKNEYKLFQNFKVKVLIPSTEEVNLKTDITCRYELIKETGIRNKYSHIRFFVTKKTGNLTYEKNRELKPERLDHNGNLFEKLEAENKLVLPDEILKEIPEKYRVKSLIDEIIKRINEGKAIDYIGLNLRYAFKKAKENPLYYAINALNKNYAGFDIEIEAKKAKEKKAQSVAMKDNESQKKREEIALDIVRSFPPEKYDALYEKAKELNAKEHPGNPFFIRDSMIEMRMAKIYMENSENNSYENNDND